MQRKSEAAGPAMEHVASFLDEAVAGFLVDRRARGLSPRTVEYCNEKLNVFREYLASQSIDDVYAIRPRTLRCFLLELGRTHNRGGVHGHYRALRAFLNWWESEFEPMGWSNPVRKVRPPKVPTDLLEPVPLANVYAMLSTCRLDSFYGCRDRAILLGLLDTGCRAREFLALSVGDVNLQTGEALVRRSKGGKSRVVFFGTTARAAIRAYVARHPDSSALQPLWVTARGTRLTYSGLREIVRRRARRAGVAVPSLHSFRRAFALGCLRNGMNVYVLQRLMGHSSLSALQRYLLQTTEDLRRAHAVQGPVDVLFGKPDSHEPAPDSISPVRAGQGAVAGCHGNPYHDGGILCRR